MTLRQSVKKSQSGKGKKFIHHRLLCSPIVENYYLVHWPEEDSVSVVFGDQLSGESVTKIGEMCKVKLMTAEASM